MVDVKKPETIIAISAALGVVGVSFYFNRLITDINERLVANTEATSAAIKKIAELQTYEDKIIKIVGGLKELHTNITKVGEDVSNINDEINNLNDEIDTIKTLLTQVIIALNDSAGTRINHSELADTSSRKKVKRSEKRKKSKKRDR